MQYMKKRTIIIRGLLIQSHSEINLSGFKVPQYFRSCFAFVSIVKGKDTGLALSWVQEAPHTWAH